MSKADRVNSTEIIVDWWVVRGWEEEGLLDMEPEFWMWCIGKHCQKSVQRVCHCIRAPD